ncbi:MAG TPA: tetratricopeptide repeat-containing sensor histidine kinase [Pedobacter sp.]|nr:tetratricopeptide repeat-containing sensor histidine kinase [Pedobacter sp.]
MVLINRLLLVLLFCLTGIFAFAHEKPDLSKIKTVKERIEAWRIYCNSLMNTTEANNKKLIREVQVGFKLCPPEDLKNRAMFSLFAGSAYQLVRDYQRAIYYYEQCALLAGKSGKTGYAVIALGQLSSMYEFTGNIPMRKRNINRMIEMADTAKDIKIRETLYSSLGGYYYDTDEYEKSMKYRLLDIELLKKISHTDTARNRNVVVGYALSNMGAMLSYLGRDQKAIEYFDEAKEYIGDYVLRNGEETLYRNYLISYLALKKPDSARVYYNLVHKGMKGIDTLYSLMSYINYSFGNYFLEEKQLDSAYHYAQLGVYYGKKSPGTDPLVESNLVYGTVLSEQGKYVEAVEYLRPGLKGSFEFDKESLSNLHKALAKSYSGLRIWDKAYHHLSEASRLSDSLLTSIADKNFNEIEGKYQNSQKIAQIKVKNLQLNAARKQQFWLLGGLALLSLVVFLLIFIYRNKKRTADVLDGKNKSLALLNDKLEEANQTKAKLFSIISHDLRSPISQVYQFLKLQQLNPQLHNEAQKQELSLRIQEATGSLLETMEDLLLWSKTQMSHFNASLQPTFLQPVILQCGQLLKLNAESKNLVILNRVPEDVSVISDPYFLQTIIRNLLQNAVKASPMEEHIDIEINRHPDLTVLSITNSGKVFTQEDYLAVLSSENNSRSLSGLGLRLVDELSAKLNHKITFEAVAGGLTKVKISFQNS